MINLCDDSKYFKDNNLTKEAKRIPRPVEDIEIIGTITSNETLDFSSLNACNIDKIASITCTFYSSNLSFTVRGDGALDPDNSREPEEDQLNAIQSGDPIRFAHGWYTISPKYQLGALITNGNVVLDNMGYNNDRTDCNVLTSNNSVIANNSLSINRLSFNDSFGYSSQFDVSSINMNNSKIDEINIICISGIYTDSSMLLCSLENAHVLSNNTNYIDVNAVMGTGNYTNGGIYRSTLITSDALSNSLGITGTAIEIDTSQISGCNITTDICQLKNLTIDNSNVTCNKLFTESTPITVNNTSITADRVDHSSIINSGILNFTHVLKLALENYAQTNADLIVRNDGSVINNYSGALLNVSSSGYLLNGSNASGAKIIGSVFTLDSFFDNMDGAEIIGDVSIINSGNNNGKISVGNFFGTATNNGSVDRATFKNGSSNISVSGKVTTAEFFDSSINTSTGLMSAIFYNNSSNAANVSSVIFKNYATNSGNIKNANFYDQSSSIGGECEDTNFYHSGICTSGNLNRCGFYDTTQCIGCVLENTSTYGNTFLQDVRINTGTIVELNNFSSGNIICNVVSGLMLNIKDDTELLNISGLSISGSIAVYDQAQVKDSIGNLKLSFFNSSKCGNSSADIILNDTSIATGDTYQSLKMNNASLVSGTNSVNIESLEMFNNSKIINRNSVVNEGRFFGSSEFYGNTITSGLVTESARMHRFLTVADIITFSGQASNYTTINGASIVFTHNSNNTISGSLNASVIKFLQNSNNYGIINSTSLFSGSVNYFRGNGNTIFYIGEGAFNRGSGNGVMHFGSGAVNLGYANTAYFYAGSSNNGLVINAYFHNSITQTGTVIGSATFDGSLAWSDPF